MQDRIDVSELNVVHAKQALDLNKLLGKVLHVVLVVEDKRVVEELVVSEQAWNRDNQLGQDLLQFLALFLKFRLVIFSEIHNAAACVGTERTASARNSLR